MKSFLRLLFVFLLSLTPGLAQEASPPPPPPPSPVAADGANAAPPSAPAGQGQPAAAAPAKKKRGEAVADFIAKGGYTIWVLIALSVVMLSLAAFVVFTVRRGAVVSDYFMRTAEALVRKQDYPGLLAVCNRRSECIARITQKALDFAAKNPAATYEEVYRVTEAEGQRLAGQLHQRVTYLSDIASVAPMVGLLGTVIGIAREFGQISKKDMVAAQMEFAGGTAEALVNTAAGLLIAIPAMFMASIYRGRVNALVSELEAAATHIMALLGAQYKRVTAARAAQQPAPQAARRKF